jgi:hypothetical protein
LSTYFKRHIIFRKADESLVSSEKFDSFFKPEILFSKTITTSERSIDE